MATKTTSQTEITALVTGLNKMARNLWWTWDQGSPGNFSRISPRAVGRICHNAVAILRGFGLRTARAFAGSGICQARPECLEGFESYLAEKDTGDASTPLRCVQESVAYFSAEFGFHETLPIAAVSVFLPGTTQVRERSGSGFVGISLFYREGYFQQTVDGNNWQTEFYSG